jgi:hypothetical protein
MAIAIEVARSRAATRDLLAATQKQAEKLAAQEEELRSTNEELQAQEEELRQANTDLSRQAEELASLGVTVDDLSVSRRQRIGAAEFVAHDAEGRPLKVRVLGRDAQDTQRLARRWRLLAYRDPPRSAPVGRLEQVEHDGSCDADGRPGRCGCPRSSPSVSLQRTTRWWSHTARCRAARVLPRR